EEDITPFSLSDLGLSAEEIAAFEGAQDNTDPAPREHEAPQSLEQTDEPDLTPFSFEELGLSAAEMAMLQDTDMEIEVPAAPTEPAPPEAPADVEPFSFDDLSLSADDDTFASLDTIQDDTPARYEEGNRMSAENQDEDEFGLQPFSLDELGLSSEEISALERMSIPAEDALPLVRDDEPADEHELDDIAPFDWSTSMDDEESFAPSGLLSSLSQGNLSDSDLPGDLRPFSLEDLNLETSFSEFGEDDDSLPPSLQPFSLEDAPDVNRPSASSGLRPRMPSALPTDTDEEPGQSSAAYSWQVPSSKSNTDFLSGGAPHESADDSIFSKLKQRRNELPPDDEPPLPPVDLSSEDEESQFFSEDDISLRLEETEYLSQEALSGVTGMAAHMAATRSEQPRLPKTKQPNRQQMSSRLKQHSARPLNQPPILPGSQSLR
ncbi:MAG: hypothetical protein HC828_12285, partial [Blastochloris sp.]|nr:hypothetical protein [Blastochloris sp.]